MTAGPALLAAVSPVVTKMPAPMMAPTPSDVRAIGPRARRSRFSPSISLRRFSSDLRAKSCCRSMSASGRRGGLRAEQVAAGRHPRRGNAVLADLAAQLLAEQAVVMAVRDVDHQAD